MGSTGALEIGDNTFAVTAVLDELDEADDALRNPTGERRSRWSYRRKNFRVDIVTMDGTANSLRVNTRAMGSKSLVFLSEQFIYPSTACTAHLFTSYNMWHCVNGIVTTCRYVGRRLHEVEVKFESEIEVAMFLAEAIERRVLVVDDDEISRTLISFHLEALYAKVETVSDHQQAMAAFHRTGFDMILLDIDMPGVDGVATLKMLRDAGCSVPVIAVTAFTGTEDSQRFIDVGFDGYVPKPIHDQSFRDLLAQFSLEPVLSSFMDRPALRPMIENFVSDLPRRIGALREALTGGDAARIQQLTRQLKADAGGLGFECIQDSAARTERIAASDPANTDAISNAITDLIALCGRARSFSAV